MCKYNVSLSFIRIQLDCRTNRIYLISLRIHVKEMATHQPIELTDGRASGEERYNGASPWGQDKELDVHRLRQTSGYLSDREASDFEAKVAGLLAKIDRRLSALGQRVAGSIQLSAGRHVSPAADDVSPGHVTLRARPAQRRSVTNEWAERAALPTTVPRSHGFWRDMHRFVKGQLSSDRSVDYVSDRRLKLPKGHGRKMHAERCFASQNVSSAADFQFDKSVKSNERVDKTGADDSTGKKPTVRSKQHAVRAQRRCVAPVSASSRTAKIDTFSEAKTDDFEMKDDNDAGVMKSGGCCDKRSGKTVAAVKQASDSAEELNVNHVQCRLLRHQPYLLADLDARYGPTVLFLRPRSLQGRRRAVAVPAVGVRTAVRTTVILVTNIIRRRGPNAAGSAHRHLTDQLGHLRRSGRSSTKLLPLIDGRKTSRWLT